MLFPSIPFLLYFLPVALALYWVFWFSRPCQNVCLLVLSLVFYAWGEPVFLVPMLLLIVVNHFLGRSIGLTPDRAQRTRIIRWAAIFNFGVLVLVRYQSAIVDFVARRFDLPVPDWRLAAPLGVSFFALQAFTYVIGIARRKAAPETNILNTGLFIAFLPTVLAGPILRFGDLATQLHTRTTTLESFGQGCERLVVGLAKLVVLAVPLSYIANDVFNRSAAGNQFYSTPVTLAWLGVFAFGLQYYLTFSGYSDMAIGLARMFGFTLRENFKYPYGAHTLREFWSRWHISMYRWFYVYIFLALGGARAKKVRIRGAMRSRNYVVRNLFILWMAVGLWHGISWNQAVFGFWFFIFAFFEWVVNLQRKNTRSPLWTLYVFFVVSVGWIFLRSYSFMESMTYLSNLIGVSSNGFLSDFALVLVKENWLVILLGLLASTPIAGTVLEWLRRPRKEGPVAYALTACHVLVLVVLLYLCLVFIGKADSIPFFLFS